MEDLLESGSCTENIASGGPLATGRIAVAIPVETHHLPQALEPDGKRGWARFARCQAFMLQDLPERKLFPFQHWNFSAELPMRGHARLGYR
jgi:hypothetical protein